MTKKKVCFLTAARSEYGLLRWLMEEIKNDPYFQLQIIVTGSHLSPEFGNTYLEIEKDGFFIDERVEMLLSTSTTEGIAKSIGLCAIGISNALHRLKPNLLIVLGDRYELLPVCSVAVIMNIPIAHISGGDITEGAIDDMVRHSITKMSTLHFPGTQESRDRIIRMGENPKNVFTVGELGLDNFSHLIIVSRKELAKNLSLDEGKNWVLMTYHPETMISIEKNIYIIKNLIEVLNTIKEVQILITKANADYGGVQINNFLKTVEINNNAKYKFIDNLGQLYYSFMKQAYCMLGNSSSGIVEAPFLKLPVINIGNRQKGRYISKNVISCNGNIKELQNAFKIISSPEFKKKLINVEKYYGDGKSAIRIKDILKQSFIKGFKKEPFYEDTL